MFEAKTLFFLGASGTLKHARPLILAPWLGSCTAIPNQNSESPLKCIGHSSHLFWNIPSGRKSLWATGLTVNYHLSPLTIKLS